jgi:hypothetical protein
MRISPYSVVLGGVSFGDLSPSGVFYNLEDLEGWDSPGSTGAVEQRSGARGGWASRAFQSPRLLRLTGGISVAEESQLEPAIDTLLEAIPLDDLGEIQVARKGSTRVAFVRQDDTPAVEILSTTEAAFDVALIAPDPYRYSVSEHVLETTLPVSSGGLSLPTSLPFSIDGGSPTGFMAASNVGNVPSPATVTIYGPVVMPSVTNSKTGERITYSLDLASDEFLVLDLDRRTALLNGVASRRGFIRGDFFSIHPGANSIAFTSPIYDPAARVSLAWRDAWK